MPSWVRSSGCLAAALLVLAWAPAPDDDGPALLAEARARLQRGAEDDMRATQDLFRRALRALPPGSAGEAQAREGLAKLHYVLGELNEALAEMDQAQRLFAGLGARADAARALDAVGVMQNALGRNHEARGSLERALAERRALGDAEGQAESLNNLAYVHFTVGDNRQALALYEQALARREALGHTAKAAETRNYVAMVYSALGDERRALEEYRRSLAVFEASGDRFWEAATRHNAARSQLMLGETDAALEQAERALAVAGSSGDPRGEAYLRHTLAKIHTVLGEPTAALEELHAARRRFEDIGDPFGLACVLMTLARQYAALGDAARARTGFERALALLREQGERPAQAQALHGLALARGAEGDWAAAERDLDEALALARDTQDRALEAALLASQGDVHRERGRLGEAERDFESSLALSAAGGQPRAQALAWERSARLAATRGEFPDAERRARRALALYRDAGDRAGGAAAAYALAQVLSARGDTQAAIDTLDPALREAERLRAAAPGDDLRTAYLASVQPWYALALELRLRRHAQEPAGGHLAAAFDWAERARARALLDALALGGVDPWEGADPALLPELTRVRRRLGACEQQRLRLAATGATAAEREALEAQADALLAELRELSVRLAAGSPRQARLAAPEPARLEDVQRRLLDDDTLLLSYALGEERSHVFLVSRGTAEAFELAGRARLEAAARRAVDALDARGRRPRFEPPAQRARRLRQADRSWPAVAAELSRLLLEPLAGRLGARRLVIVAPGVLQQVPFAALPEPGGGRSAAPLIETHEIVGAPSASVLLALRTERQPPPANAPALALLADPVFEPGDARLGGRSAGDLPGSARRLASEGEWGTLRRLPHTRREAERIRALLPAPKVKLALGFDARRGLLDEPATRDARILHFATHALVDDRRPEFSGLVLSLYDRRGQPQDGVLHLADVYRLPLRSDLVVLSACRTAVGRDMGGEGLQSLARGFFHAGARRLVASLWSAGDAATAELMARFYTQLVRRGRTPAAALRQAQRDLRRDPRWRHARDWAAFTLQGDWRP